MIEGIDVGGIGGDAIVQVGDVGCHTIIQVSDIGRHAIVQVSDIRRHTIVQVGDITVNRGDVTLDGVDIAAVLAHVFIGGEQLLARHRIARRCIQASIF